ncbi:hypothetical protein D3C71_1418670 [compost metagenome]
MLGGHNDGVDTNGSVIIILHGYLRLAVRTQIRQQSALAGLCQSSRQLVGQRDRQREQLRRLIRRITEHQSLVACSELAFRLTGIDQKSRFQRLIHTLGNIGRLLVKRTEDGASMAVEAE